MSDPSPPNSKTVDPQRSARWLIVSVAIVLVFYLLPARSQFASWFMDSSSGLGQIVSAKLLELLVMGVVAGWIVWLSPKGLTALGLQFEFWPGDILVGACAGVCCFFVSMAIVYAVDSLLPGLKDYVLSRPDHPVRVMGSAARHAASNRDFIYVVLVVLLAVLPEELFARGIVQSLARREPSPGVLLLHRFAVRLLDPARVLVPETTQPARRDLCTWCK